jgi:hypothetical protein
MGGVKGRSGPPNNVNAARNGHRILWRRGRHGVLRPEDAWVRKPMQDFVDRFLAHLPDATAHQREVIETAATAKGCELLLGQALQEEGLVKVVDGRMVVSKVCEDLVRFMRLKLDALRLLPAERRAKAVMSLDQYVQEKYSQRNSTEHNDNETP